MTKEEIVAAMHDENGEVIIGIACVGDYLGLQPNQTPALHNWLFGEGAAFSTEGKTVEGLQAHCL